MPKMRPATKLQSKRIYASFFDWPDKPVKERGVVQSLFDSMKTKGELKYTGLRYGSHPNSAPDCIAVDQNDELVAIEVTEFVCKNAEEQNQKGNNVYRDWQSVEVITEVHKIIFKKDQVNFVGGPYSKKILVIHTNELILEPEAYQAVEIEVVKTAIL